MTTTLLLEIFAGFFTAFMTLWMVTLNRPRTLPEGSTGSDSRHRSGIALPPFLQEQLRRYFLRDGRLLNSGLLILRLAIGLMMIHHGQDKLGNPQSFADTYVAPLHLPFPLFFAYVAGYSEILGSWLLILGLLSPLGALALTGTMGVAAYHHILTGGLNIYVLELVVLYLGGSLALLLIGPGRFSFDAGIMSELLDDAPQEGGVTQAQTIGTSTYGLVGGAG
jgi:putative oxidoreductase